MKATFVLLANYEADNLAKKILLEAHKIGRVGFESARIPSHISLKQPFKINSLEEIERYFDEFSSNLKAMSIELTTLDYLSINSFAYESGLIWFNINETKELRHIHNNLNKELEERFGSTKANFDGVNYRFHMTIALAGKPFDVYKDTFEKLEKKEYNKTYVFDEIALLYYDDDVIKPGTYISYKRIKLGV